MGVSDAEEVGQYINSFIYYSMLMCLNSIFFR